MEAKARAFTFLGNEALIKVPFFQRGYVWKKENWDELLAELSNTSKSHFLGSIILKQQTVKTGDAKEVLLIDGQQRLTTLSILIKALYDSFPDSTKKNCENALRQYLFYKTEQTDIEFLIKIQHSQIDAEAFEAIMRSGLDDIPQLVKANGDLKNRIYGCYFHFKAEIKDRPEKERIAIFNWILKNENQILVVIDLGLDDDEQAIFDTINSAGVRLSAADIIKNSLFQRVIQFEGQKEATKLYKETWDKVMSSDEESILFWEKPRVTGRLRRDNIEILLHSIAVIKGFYDPDEHTLSDLSKLYKNQISSFGSKDELRKFINDIKEYAIIFRNKIPVFDKSTLFAYENHAQRLFHILESFEITTFHPFILLLFKQFSDDEEGLLKIFASLESFVLRRVLSKHEVKSFNKFCKEFIEHPNALFERLAESKNNDFDNELRGISNRHAALILFWIELRRRALDKKNDLKHLKYDYSLEHIMPQSWEEHWPKLPEKKNPDGTKMSTENSKNDRWEKIYWIGNMTLLTTNLNSAIRNNNFKTKIEGEGRKKGIRAYADLQITKADILEPFDGGDKVWDENKIIQRTEKLITEIDAIWKK